MSSEKCYYDGYLINFSSGTGYPTIWVNGKNTLLHRYVWEKYNGEIPEGYEVHHKDKNRRNYSIDNLEIKSVKDHHRKHAIENDLGKNNKGKPKLYSSGCCKEPREVTLIKDDEEKTFYSINSASRFLGLKNSGQLCTALSKGRMVKGWRCLYGGTRKTI